MQHLEPITEDEMVAVFLRTELASSRFGAAIAAVLERHGLRRGVVEEPDLTRAEDNAARRRVLGEHRGYGRSADVFTNFPRAVRWYRAQLSLAELAAVRYIDDDYWTELSGGSRLIADAVARIRRGIEAYGVGNDGFWWLADALCRGAQFPELILVGKREGAPLVVLEGHARATAYLLRPDCAPDPIAVLVGYAPAMEK